MSVSDAEGAALEEDVGGGFATYEFSSAGRDAWIGLDVLIESLDWRGLGDLDGIVTAATAAAASALKAEPAGQGKQLRPVLGTLALTNDAAIRSLNRSFRGFDKPTNVLSFPSAAGVFDGDRRLLGDIAMAWETIAREAVDLGIPVEHHVQHLVVHGLLHLLGYDHEADEDAARMEGLETRILAALGVADPYADVALPP